MIVNGIQVCVYHSFFHLRVILCRMSFANTCCHTKCSAGYVRVQISVWMKIMPISRMGSTSHICDILSFKLLKYLCLLTISLTEYLLTSFCYWRRSLEVQEGVLLYDNSVCNIYLQTFADHYASETCLLWFLGECYSCSEVLHPVQTLWRTTLKTGNIIDSCFQHS